MAVFHAVLASLILVISIFLNPIGFFCSGVVFISFQLFILSWWLWRFPPLDVFQDRFSVMIMTKPHLTTKQKERKVQFAWRLQLGFVLLWGWFCALLFWWLASWMTLQGICSLNSILLLGGFFTSIIVWVIGGAGIVYFIFRNRKLSDEL